MKLDDGWAGGARDARASRAEGQGTGRGGGPATAPKSGKQDGLVHPWWKANRKMKEKERLDVAPAGQEIKFL
jgi:hypothetical protein